MRYNLHALDTSHMRVSGDRVELDKWTNSRKEPPTEVSAALL